MASLHEALGKVGLGEYADVFAAEKIDLETIGELAEDDLRELGLPMGARIDVLKLFGTTPRPPDRPSPSHHSPLRSRHTDGGGTVAEWSKRESGKQFACFIRYLNLAPNQSRPPLTNSRLQQPSQGVVCNGSKIPEGWSVSTVSITPPSHLIFVLVSHLVAFVSPKPEYAPGTDSEGVFPGQRRSEGPSAAPGLRAG